MFLLPPETKGWVQLALGPRAPAPPCRGHSSTGGKKRRPRRDGEGRDEAGVRGEGRASGASAEEELGQGRLEE